MTAGFELATIVGFLLALVRTTAWMAVSPPFNTRQIPRLVKLGCAAGISMVVAPQLPTDQITLETGPLLGMILIQVATGLVLGFITQMLFAAVQAAGSLIDLFGGFTLTQSLDPFMNNQSSVFGRFYGLIAVTLLFVINGHLLLIKGFMTSFEAVPLGGIELDSLKEVIIGNVSTFMLAALEIVGPLLAAFFLAEVALGLLSKAAPQLNIFTFGFPFKILLTLLLIMWAIPVVPEALQTLLNNSLRDGISVLASGRR